MKFRLSAASGFLIGLALAVPAGFLALILYVVIFGLFFFGDIPAARGVQRAADYAPFAGAFAAVAAAVWTGRSVERGAALSACLMKLLSGFGGAILILAAISVALLLAA